MKHTSTGPAHGGAPTLSSAPTLRLQRKCACGAGAGLSGDCEDCQSTKLLGLQAKLVVGEANDHYEQEADRIAERVTAGGEATPGVNAPLQLQRTPSREVAAHDAPTPVREALSSPSRSLDAPTRAYFEPRFGHDFSRVRVHDGEAADVSTRAVGAHAYTVGSHVVFAGGQYAPHSSSGRKLIAHELAHVVQQSQAATATPSLQAKRRPPGGCGLLSFATEVLLGAAAHRQIQSRLAGRGFGKEVMIPRAKKSQALTGDIKCKSRDTAAGFADVFRTTGRKGVSEIKPFGIAGIAGTAEAAHYQLRATQSKERLTGTGACGRHGAWTDDQTFNSQAGPFTAATPIDLLKGAISGTEEFGAYQLNPNQTLKAKEVAPGAIGYWCVKKKNTNKKKDKKKDKKKTQGKKPNPKPKAKPKPKPRKPTIPKTTKPTKPKAPKPQGKGGGLNIGFGLSLFSIAVGAVNAGLGISIASASASVGTAGAGVDIGSDSAATASAGVGVGKDNTGAAAGTAGIGSGSDNTSLSAGTAGAGDADKVDATSTGAAGEGKASNSKLSGSESTGQGEIKDSNVEGKDGNTSGKMENVHGKGSGSTSKPVDVKDVTGDAAGEIPADEAAAEAADGGGSGDQAAGEGDAGEGEGETGSEADASADTVEGEQGGTEPSAAAGGKQATAGGGATPGKGTTPDGKAGGGAASTHGVGVLPVFGDNATDADRERAAEEMLAVMHLLDKAGPGQVALLLHLANSSGNKQYSVPTSEWVDKLLTATEGISPEDLEYLKTLDWKPGSISAEELRKRVAKALQNKRMGKPAASTGASGSAGATPGGKVAAGAPGTAGKGSDNTGSGKGENAASKPSSADAPVGKQGEGELESGGYTKSKPYTEPVMGDKVGHVDYAFVTNAPLSASTKVDSIVTMTLTWPGSDGKQYYHRLAYKVTGKRGSKDTIQEGYDVDYVNFVLEPQVEGRINIAPEGQPPFLLHRGMSASYRIVGKMP